METAACALAGILIVRRLSRTSRSAEDAKAVRFRRATADDVRSIAELWHSTYFDQVGVDLLAPEFLAERRELAFFAPRVLRAIQWTTVACRVCDDGEIVGFTVAHGGEVDQLFVARSARGLGVGEALLRAAEDSDSDSASSRMWLYCLPENAPARAFYERCGYTSSGEEVTHGSPLSDGRTFPLQLVRYEKKRARKQSSASTLPPLIHAIIHEAWGTLDDSADAFLRVLKASPAVEIWHKHGHFYSHLHDVWSMLCAWRQPRAIARLGLFHSAYSNSFVSMGLYDAATDRAQLTALIGAEAESLVWKFCVIDRQKFEDVIVESGAIPPAGLVVSHIRDPHGAKITLSPAELAAFVIETVADYMDQSFGWQSDMEFGRRNDVGVSALEREGPSDELELRRCDRRRLWPTEMRPTLRMAMLSIMANAARPLLDVVPPIFHQCTVLLSEADELRGRDLYWDVVAAPHRPGAEQQQDQAALDGEARAAIVALTEASRYNPFVAEPHIVRAQLLMELREWRDAAAAARRGVEILCDWATAWDKRMPFAAWLSWARCLIFQAELEEWPITHGGMESLGAVHAAQRFRGLNTAGRRFS